MSKLHPRKILPRYRRLMKDGAQGEAVVLENFSDGVAGGWRRMRLGVRFPDGTTTEFVREEPFHNLDGGDAGDRLPVRYDPNDHSRIELDIPKMRRQRADGEARVQAEQQEQSQQLMDDL